MLHFLVLIVTSSAAEAAPTATASVQKIRYWAESGTTRVVIDLDADSKYESARLTEPDRVYFDISDARLSSDFTNDAVAAKGELLKRVRVAQNRADRVRVVLDIAGTADYRVSELHNPSRIAIDLYDRSGIRMGTGRVRTAESHMETGTKTASEGADVPQATAPGGQVSPASDEVNKAGPGQNQHLLLSTAAGLSPPEEDSESLPSAPGPGIMVVRPPAAAQPANKKIQKTAKNAVVKPASSREMERPLTIDGTFSSGYYNSYAKGGGNGDQRISFVPADAALNLNGYYLSPDMLNYFIQSEMSTGSQASDAGFEGGNGISTRISALRTGAFPMTFRYSNMQLKDAYFGSLTQVSSYTQKNRNKDLGLTVGLNISGLPAVTIDWGTSSVQSQSFTPAIPDYTSRSSHLNLNCSDRRWGWDFQCFAARQQQSSDLYSPQVEGTNSSLLRQQVTQFRGSARRSFLGDSELSIDGGNQSTSNIVLNQPIDLTTRYASANLRMFQKRRWKTSLRAGYTSNIAGLVLTQLVGGLSGNGSIAPDATVVHQFQRTTSYLNLNGLTSVDLSHGLGLYGSLDRTSVLTASDSGLSSKYTTAAGGITYSRTFGWGSLSGQYGRSLGIGSITGMTGRIDGQNYLLTVQPGRPDGLQFDFSVRGSDQSVKNQMPAREHSLASDAGVGLPLFWQFRVRLGGGWQQNVFSNQGNEFHTNGYTARAGIENPRFQLNGSLNSSVGNSLQAYSQLVNGLGLESAFLTPLRIVPSSLQGVAVTLHVIPTRKLELSGLFTRSVQHLEGIVTNDFEVIDVYLTFHFRKLQLVSGYFRSTQIYTSYLAVYPLTERGRFYLRFTRPAKIL